MNDGSSVPATSSGGAAETPSTYCKATCNTIDETGASAESTELQQVSSDDTSSGYRTAAPTETASRSDSSSAPYQCAGIAYNGFCDTNV